MEDRNRTIFMVLIAVVIAAAVFSSFGLNLFAPDTAQVELPRLTPSPTVPSGGGGEADPEAYVRIDVTPQTVQNVVKTMTPLRPGSYHRSVTVNTALTGGAVSTVSSEVWTDGGWTKVLSTYPNGMREHTLIGDKRAYRWFNENTGWNEWAVEGEREANLAQHLPTYEDVLSLEIDSITAAGYEEKNGVSCIYVEAAENEVGNRERYWISVSSGLLEAAETWNGEELVLSMTAGQVEIPVSPDAIFALPDGRVLHTVAD